jgi:hypothetical protein
MRSNVTKKRKNSLMISINLLKTQVNLIDFPVCRIVFLFPWDRFYRGKNIWFLFPVLYFSLKRNWRINSNKEMTENSRCPFTVIFLYCHSSNDRVIYLTRIMTFKGMLKILVNDLKKQHVSWILNCSLFFHTHIFRRKKCFLSLTNLFKLVVNYAKLKNNFVL